MPGRILKRTPRLAAVVAALALAASVAGCGSMIADLPTVGLPAGVPERPANPGAFPDVHDNATVRDEEPLSAADRARIEAELVAARARQKAATGR